MVFLFGLSFFQPMMQNAKRADHVGWRTGRRTGEPYGSPHRPPNKSKSMMSGHKKTARNKDVAVCPPSFGTPIPVASIPATKKAYLARWLGVNTKMHQ